MRGEQSVVSDAVEAFGQDVDQEAADELIDIEGHGLMANGVAAIVLVPEGDKMAVIGDESGVGEGDAVGIAAEVLEHGFGSGERWFDMDVPVEVTQGSQVGCKGFVIGEFPMVTEEVQTMLVVGLVQLLEQQVPKAPREHLVRQQVSGTAGDPAFAIGR